MTASPPPEKLYFRIGEVAEIVGVQPHVLRYWEREFKSIRPTKSRTGQRVYARRDVETLARVKELLYKRGFTIAGARKHLRGSTAEASEGGREPEAASASANIATREQLIAIRREVETFLAELGK